MKRKLGGSGSGGDEERLTTDGENRNKLINIIEADNGMRFLIDGSPSLPPPLFLQPLGFRLHGQADEVQGSDPARVQGANSRRDSALHQQGSPALF